MRRGNHGKEVSNPSSPYDHDGDTQKDGGGTLTTLDAPIDLQTQQTQPSATIQLQGDDRQGAEIAQATPSPHPLPINENPTPATMSDANIPPNPALPPLLFSTTGGKADGVPITSARTTMSTSTIASIEAGFPGIIVPDFDTSSIANSPSTIRLPPLLLSAPSVLGSSVPTSETVSLATSTSAMANDGTISGDVPGSPSPPANIAYAAIAPAIFAILVLAATLVRWRQKKKRALEAETNLRSDGVLAGEKGRKFGVGKCGVSIIAVPFPPPRGERSRSDTLRTEDKNGLRMHSLPSSIRHLTIPPRRDGERELRDSDIYSPRYYTPSNQTSASSTQRVRRRQQEKSSSSGTLPGVSSMELADPSSRAIHHLSPQTPPPTLPPLPSPDLNDDWLPECLNSPARLNTVEDPSNFPTASLARSLLSSGSADRHVPKLSPRSPPVIGPNIQSRFHENSSCGNSLVTPFHRNYKKLSDVPPSRTERRVKDGRMETSWWRGMDE
ncbi:hypothetical protein FKW77_001186 [Venturia effusa]|uniref:Uncharacterized protein n=1 Tax=Venturia effusa TaxID=50376 RepID=A0A517LI22_9PEZI|nr:hypothetical protein FKW77_001186 [Venturia effusa]